MAIPTAESVSVPTKSSQSGVAEKEILPGNPVASAMASIDPMIASSPEGARQSGCHNVPEQKRSSAARWCMSDSAVNTRACSAGTAVRVI